MRLRKPERFWSKVDASGDCWEWTAARQPSGHGRFYIDGKVQRAHRVAYELLVGPIPDGLHIDHLCLNTSCVNPDHLEPVTAGTNVLRGYGPTAMEARQTHCKHGHLFNASNTYWRGRKRQCRECAKLHQRRLRAERRAA